MPTFAEASSGVPSNASVAMNSDMVKPIAAEPAAAVQRAPADALRQAGDPRPDGRKRGAR